MKSIRHFLNISDFLGHLLIERQLKNKSYSLRSFARDLGLQSGALSQVLNKKRTLSFAMTIQVAYKLKLTDDDRYYLLELLTLEIITNPNILIKTQESIKNKHKILIDYEFLLNQQHSNGKNCSKLQLSEKNLKKLNETIIKKYYIYKKRQLIPFNRIRKNYIGLPLLEAGLSETDAMTDMLPFSNKLFLSISFEEPSIYQKSIH